MALGRALLVLFFFPRGGSAQVVRALARALPACGWAPAIAAGSRGRPGAATNAATFFGRRVPALEYGEGGGRAEPGSRGLVHAGMQPSYEDRPGRPDPPFPCVDDLAYERLVHAWAKVLARARAAEQDVIHLNHLTPAHEAAARVAPHVPRLTQLHGTELALLRAIDANGQPGWPHAGAWAARMRRWARESARLVVHPGSEAETAALLGVDRGRVVAIPGGIDLDCFRPHPLAPAQRLRLWQRWLCEAPRGWDESGRVGSVGYRADQVSILAGSPVIVYAGRFTAVKRVSSLLRAYALARPSFTVRAPLVVIGGHPGEWEGEHPAAVIRTQRIEDVFLAGWRPQTELAEAFNAADVFILASERESFGLAAAEAMACGLPVITTATGGPREIIRDGRSGWLLEPDDLDGLSRALREAVNDPAERRRRGANAARDAKQLSWHHAAQALAETYITITAKRHVRRAATSPDALAGDTQTTS